VDGYAVHAVIVDDADAVHDPVAAIYRRVDGASSAANRPAAVEPSTLPVTIAKTLPA